MIDFQRHAFKQYDAEVSALLKSIDCMGGQVIAILKAITEGVSHSGDASDDVAARAKGIDKQINLLEDEINHQVNTIIARYQPMGDELRLIVGVVRVSTVLESLGDLCKSCARRFTSVKPIEPEVASKFQHLIQSCIRTLEEALQSINAFDPATAKKIAERENLLDQEAGQLTDELKASIAKNPLHVAELLMLARDIERIGDQCYMVAKLDYYFETGISPRNKNYAKIKPSDT